jgi:hypothetical protein
MVIYYYWFSSLNMSDGTSGCVQSSTIVSRYECLHYITFPMACRTAINILQKQLMCEDSGHGLLGSDTMQGCGRISCIIKQVKETELLPGNINRKEGCFLRACKS